MPDKPESSKSNPNPPKLLAVVNGKGGVGKTTTAVNLASIWGKNRRVLLVDADPQGSSTWWVERNEKGMGFDLAKSADFNHFGELRGKPHDLIVIDTPPALRSELLTSVLSESDYIVLPTPPAPMDLMALIDTVRSAVKPLGVSYRVLLTKVDSRSLKETLEAQNTLLELGIPACHAFVRSFKAHEKAVLEGVSIADWRGKNAGEAAADYKRVAEELERDWKS